MPSEDGVKWAAEYVSLQLRGGREQLETHVESPCIEVALIPQEVRRPSTEEEGGPGPRTGPRESSELTVPLTFHSSTFTIFSSLKLPVNF